MVACYLLVNLTNHRTFHDDDASKYPGILRQIIFAARPPRAILMNTRAQHASINNTLPGTDFCLYGNTALSDRSSY